MSFSFNFDVNAHTATSSDEDWNRNKCLSVNLDNKVHETKRVHSTLPVKEAIEHFVPADHHSLFEDVVSETVSIGSLPPLHFLNESVFEWTASEREDEENILCRSSAQRSDLISGVYEGGLKVWECTYDLLELVERQGETFGGKCVLDLGCGAGLLGILPLKRGAKQVHFQDYNSTVIEQLTLPNVLLNCQEEEEGREDEEGSREEEGKRWKKEDRETKRKGEMMKGEDGDPPSKKRELDPLENSRLSRCRFFSGDWTSFLALVLKENPSPKYDIIFTSETIYNTAYYPTLHDTLHKLLASDGLVFLATKAHYFGVGGGLHLFEKFVEDRGIFSVKHLWHGKEGLQRHVVGLCFKTAWKC